MTIDSLLKQVRALDAGNAKAIKDIVA